MSKVAELESLDELAAHLERWVKNNPSAVQLDGSLTRKNNREVLAIVWVAHEKSWYKIPGDCGAKAIKTFLMLYKEKRRDSLLLRRSKNSSGLIIATSTRPDGWYCYFYSNTKAAPVRRHAHAA